eukprot:COSAG06_NODE_35808_length_455_cov_0.980337_1_plen_91_part_01
MEEPRATCVARGRRGDEEADPATLTASARDGGCSSTTGAAAAAGTCGWKKCAIAIRRRATPPYAGSYPCEANGALCCPCMNLPNQAPDRLS